MQKSFCDICKKEIEQDALVGGLMRKVATYPIMKTPQGDVVQKRVRIQTWDLCEECQKSIWKFGIEKKENLEKVSKIIKGTK